MSKVLILEEDRIKDHFRRNIRYDWYSNSFSSIWTRSEFFDDEDLRNFFDEVAYEFIDRVKQLDNRMQN